MYILYNIQVYIYIYTYTYNHIYIPRNKKRPNSGNESLVQSKASPTKVVYILVLPLLLLDGNQTLEQRLGDGMITFW